MAAVTFDTHFGRCYSSERALPRDRLRRRAGHVASQSVGRRRSLRARKLDMVAWSGRRLAAMVVALLLTACSTAPPASPTAAPPKPTEAPAAKPAAASPQPAAASPAAGAAAAASPAAAAPASGAAARPAPKNYPKPDGWDALVEAAKKEGSVVVLGPPGQTPRQAVV